jgi:tetratricopeptide (TPR) repeat protein
MLSFLFINSPGQMAHYYIADGPQLESWTGPRELVTDDFPRLEFSAPRYLLRDESTTIADRLCRADGVPVLAGDPDSLLNRQFLEELQDQRNAKELLLRSENAASFRENLEYCLQIARYAPQDMRLVRYINRQLTKLTDLAPAGARPTIDAYYEKIISAAPAIRSIREAGTVDRTQLPWPLGKRLAPAADPELVAMTARTSTLLEQGELEQAVASAAETARLFPYDPAAQRLAGIATLQLRGPDAALPYLLKAWNMHPADPETSYNLTCAYCLRGDPDRALTFLQTAVANGFDDLVRIESGDVFGCLHDDPRFQQLLAQMRGEGR